MEGSEQPASVSETSSRYMIFLVIVMGLASQMDSWLSLIESKAVPGILSTYAVDLDYFLLWQGIFGVIVFGVFFIGWFSDAYGRRKGMMALVLVMGVPTILIVFLAVDLFTFLLFYSIIIMGTTSNLWEVPISEEAPPARRGLYGSIAFLIGVIPLYAILGTNIIDNFGWQWGYGIMFFLMVALMILLVFMKDPQRWKDTAGQREGLGIIEALRRMKPEDRRYIIIATAVYLAWTISFKMATTLGGQYFTTVVGMTDSEFNTILTIAGLLLPVSALISGVLLDKVGRNLVLIMGSIGSVVTLAALGLTQMSIFYQLAYFFMAMVLAWIYVYLGEIFATEVRTTSIGVCVTGARLGYVVGPLLSSFLVVAFPAFDGLWVFAGILMIIPLFTLLAKPLETKGKTLEEIEAER
jgi:MFS family permease